LQLRSYRQVRVPNLSLNIMCDVLDAAHLDHHGALAAVGLNLATAQTPGAMITGQQELDFQREFVARTAGRPDLWMKAGRSYSIASFGAWGLALITSPTLADVVRLCARMDLTYSFVQYSPIERDGELVGVRVTYPDPLADLVPFSVHRDIVSTLRAWSALAQRQPFPLVRVCLPLTEVTEEFAEFVAAPVTLGETDVILEWNPSLSTESLPYGNAFHHETYLRQAAEQLARFRLEQDWARVVVDAIKDTIGAGAAMTDVAKRLHTSVRTLQRRLTDGGMSFRQLRDLARCEMAAKLLTETNMPVAEIAHRLGFEEPASFSIAFRRWSGLTPSQYRTAPTPLF
jgi:AraC-like DNA-binding protein